MCAFSKTIGLCPLRKTRAVLCRPLATPLIRSKSPEATRPAATNDSAGLRSATLTPAGCVSISSFAGARNSGVFCGGTGAFVPGEELLAMRCVKSLSALKDTIRRTAAVARSKQSVDDMVSETAAMAHVDGRGRRQDSTLCAASSAAACTDEQ
jgi:hypothetical protein